MTIHYNFGYCPDLKHSCRREHNSSAIGADQLQRRRQAYHGDRFYRRIRPRGNQLPRSQRLPQGRQARLWWSNFNCCEPPYGRLLRSRLDRPRERRRWLCEDFLSFKRRHRHLTRKAGRLKFCNKITISNCDRDQWNPPIWRGLPDSPDHDNRPNWRHSTKAYSRDLACFPELLRRSFCPHSAHPHLQ